MPDDFPEIASPRPAWLMTLADLALLLVGFFVFVQASPHVDPDALARGIREGFGAREPAAPIAVAAGGMNGFAPGSAVLPGPSDALAAWTREATRDPRTTLTVTGAVDGSMADVDGATGSGAVLASDRARAVAAALIARGAVPPGRIAIGSAVRPGRRAVTVTTGFAGNTLPSGNRSLP